MKSDLPSGYEPTLSKEEINRLLRWHERAYQELAGQAAIKATYLGLDIEVPAGVFPPTPVSDLLGAAVLEEATWQDRVLDMGTGSGINAILAAKVAREVVGVDVNPLAIAAARSNARANDVSDRVHFLESDLFEAVSGTFDLIVFDPPFRWMKPRNMLERSITDEGYETLSRFFTQAREWLTPQGRILLFFGTSGDYGYLRKLMRQNAFAWKVLASRSLEKDGTTVEYFTHRLVP